LSARKQSRWQPIKDVCKVAPESAMVKLLIVIDGSEHSGRGVQAGARPAPEAVAEAVLLSSW
jgi:hypothetical protein